MEGHQAGHTQEGFLGEEDLGQGLAEGLRVIEGAGPAPASFRPNTPSHAPPRPPPSPPPPPGALPPHQPQAFLPLPVSSRAWASPARPHTSVTIASQGTEGGQPPQTHTA